MAYRYVFGPVRSGRLGRSLGLDLLGERLCSMDCVYCEVGPTRTKTLARSTPVPARAILSELAAWRDEGADPPDAVSLGGLGEPSLSLAMAEVIEGARALLPGVAVAVLTNASLMDDPAVRRDLALADVVLPSLDSLVEAEFAGINRPCPGLTAAGVARGILEFRKEFTGKIFLEILLAKGYNDTDENLGRLRDFCRRLTPDRVDVVTLTRPGTVRGVGPVDGATLNRWRMALGAGVAPDSARGASGRRRLSRQGAAEQVRASLARRPQTLAQLAEGLTADPELVRRAVAALVEAGAVVSCQEQGETFYHGSDRPDRDETP